MLRWVNFGRRLGPKVGHYCTPIHILIDGKDIIDLVRAVEFPFAKQEGHPNIAGGYASLSLNDIAPPSRRFWGNAGENDNEEEKIAVLTCADCGEEMCWPLLVKIEVSGNEVKWLDFEQPYRKSWSYEGFGPFVFDRNQYEEQLTLLKAKV